MHILSMKQDKPSVKHAAMGQRQSCTGIVVIETHTIYGLPVRAAWYNGRVMGDTPTETTDVVVVRFLAFMEAEKNASPRTVEAYRRSLGQFRGWMGERFAAWEDCATGDFRAWLSEALEQELNPATIRLRFAALRSFYLYLMRREGLASNPLETLALPKARHSLPVHLNISQMEELLALPLHTPVDKKSPAWLPLRDAAILELFYSCGMRLSELVSLNEDALQADADCVRVLGKGRKVRLIPVGDSANIAMVFHSDKNVGYVEHVIRIYGNVNALNDSAIIGEIVMDQLKDLDAVAYVRFASVYREFKDANRLTM